MDDRLYTAREIATKTRWNPKGMGLLPFDYIYVSQKINQGKLKYSEMRTTAGGHKKYKFSINNISNYLEEYVKDEE